MRNNRCKKKDKLETIWEYEPSEDVDDRLAEIFDFLLANKNSLEEERKCLTKVNYDGNIIDKQGELKDG